MKKKLKVRYIHFAIAKYGGIVEQIENRIAAFKELGHDADIIRLTYDVKCQEGYYKSKVNDLETGVWESKITPDSDRRGYEKSKITGYWKNSYFGWLLPPYKNEIPVRHERALEFYNEAIKDCDIIFWSFMPTKTTPAEGLNDWWKYFDLPQTTKQVFIVHDGYFDVRSSWVSILKDKITYFECVHVASFNCCVNIGIPRMLILSQRLFPERKFALKKSEREIDYFSAHIFKSMKRMDELIRAIPYFEEGHQTIVAGADIEYSYMVSPNNTKEKYLARRNEDKDLPIEIEKKKIKIWDRAVEAGMVFAGMIKNSDVHLYQQNSKFFIDPSWCKHYAKYNRTNINSSVIEAIINGCYPVIRDYEGLVKNKLYKNDPLFDMLKAVVIPWNATPKEFATYLKDANERITDQQYERDTEYNFNNFRELSDARIRTQVALDVLYNYNIDGLELGEDSDSVMKQTEDVMKNFFKIKLPINWKY